MQPRLLDPHGTVAVVLGAHDWTRAGLPRAYSFRRSAGQWLSYLIVPAPHGLGIEPDLVLPLFDDPSSADDQLTKIRDHVKGLIAERRNTEQPVKDILIYYVGHGSSEGARHLYLLVRNSSQGYEEDSSIGTDALARCLRVAAPQQRRLVILDCCFSEEAVQAFGAMGALDDAVAATAMKDLAPEGTPPEQGTLLFCSTPRKRAGIGRPDAPRTLFTGALLDLLREGSSTRPNPMLSFADLREDVYHRILVDYPEDPPRPVLHQTDQHMGDLMRWPAFPNVAVLTRDTKTKHDDAAEAQTSKRPELKPEQREPTAAAQTMNLADASQAAPEAVKRAESTGGREDAGIEPPSRESEPEQHYRGEQENLQGEQETERPEKVATVTGETTEGQDQQRQTPARSLFAWLVNKGSGRVVSSIAIVGVFVLSVGIWLIVRRGLPPSTKPNPAVLQMPLQAAEEPKPPLCPTGDPPPRNPNYVGVYLKCPVKDGEELKAEMFGVVNGMADPVKQGHIGFISQFINPRASTTMCANNDLAGNHFMTWDDMRGCPKK